MSISIRMDREYQTRGGEEVQIYTTGAPHPHPVIGIRYDEKMKAWVPMAWTITGHYHAKGFSSDHDLVMMLRKKIVFANMHEDDRGEQIDFYPSRESAIQTASTMARNGTRMISVAVPVEIEEGYNLDLLPD